MGNEPSAQAESVQFGLGKRVYGIHLHEFRGKSMTGQAPPELSGGVERGMVATPFQGSVCQGFEDAVAQLVWRLKEIEPLCLQHPMHLVHVLVDPGDVLKQVKTQHNVKALIRIGQLLSGLNL